MPGLFAKINSTVLVAPLDWGLGHATRCIPIINYLLQKQCRVIIASSGPQLQLLQAEFPQITCIHLNGYGVQYSKKNLMLKLLTQLPSIAKSIQNEHKWLQQTIAKYKIDTVISDNRYGLYSTAVPCTIITHQLAIMPPKGFSWAKPILNKIIYKYINKFSQCWVPDLESQAISLAGKLSHPGAMPKVPTFYVGWLSRFSSPQQTPAISPQKKYQLAICLSGPEPQRTLLENILLAQLPNIKGPVYLVRGLPQTHTPLAHTMAHVQVANHLPTAAMQQLLLQSQYVISRSGYTTLMDMQILQCQCIYIPTPGQTEQVYLGTHISNSKKALVVPQQHFNLANALALASQFQATKNTIYTNHSLEQVVNKFVGI
jgi:predicted glycosyltransferase